MKNLLRILFFIFIIFILILFLLKAVDFNKTKNLIEDFPPVLLIGLLLFSLILSFIKAFRFYLITRPTSNLSVWQSMKIYLSGQALSPLPGGAAIRALMIKQETGDSIAFSSGPLIAVSFMELVAALIMTIIGSILFNLFRIPAIIVAMLLILIGIMLFDLKYIKFIFKKINKIKNCKKQTDKIVVTLESVKESIFKPNKIPNREFSFAFVLAIIGNILGGIMLFYILKQFNTNLAIEKSVFIYTCSLVIATVTGILPGGIGTTEGGMTGILLASGVTLSNSFAVVIIYRLITLVFYFLIGLIFLIIFYPKLIFKHK